MVRQPRRHIINGKGSKRRPYNKKIWDKNYQQINWRSKNDKN